MNKAQKVILIVLATIAAFLIVLAFVKPKGQAAVEDSEQIVATPTPTVEIISFEIDRQPTPVPKSIDDSTDMEPDSIGTGAENSSGVSSEDGGTSGTVLAEEYAFTLSVGKSNIPIAYGVDEDVLEQTPGWLTTSAKPGTEGVCVIYGHRNRKHLLPLKNADFGDTLSITMADGTAYTYTMESIEILESDAELKIPTLSGQHLMLTTCYPFYYTGHAPKKYVVIAGR